MPDAVTQGEFARFLQKNHFISKGSRNTLYLGILNGQPRVVTFHYHKDKDVIPTGTLSAMAKQLGISKNELIDKVKNREN